MKGRLAALLLALPGCLFFVDDPEGWVAPEAGASAGASGQGGAPCSAGDGRCSCDGGDDGKSCNSQSFAGAVCCADLDYPGKNTSCSCERFTCRTEAGGCSCQISSTHGSLSECKPEGFDSICCRWALGCECTERGQALCEEGDPNHVQSCTTSTVKCSSGRRVMTCDNPPD